MTQDLPTTERVKQEAKAFRRNCAVGGVHITHAQALEQIAHDYGFRDWNALHAATRVQTANTWAINDRVTGHYLSQAFTAVVLATDEVRPGWFMLVLDLDKAVDVVRFESFSNLRQQIRVVVGPEGFSRERTSDGNPHVTLDRF